MAKTEHQKIQQFIQKKDEFHLHDYFTNHLKITEDASFFMAKELVQGKINLNLIKNICEELHLSDACQIVGELKRREREALHLIDSDRLRSLFDYLNRKEYEKALDISSQTQEYTSDSARRFIKEVEMTFKRTKAMFDYIFLETKEFRSDTLYRFYKQPSQALDLIQEEIKNRHQQCFENKGKKVSRSREALNEISQNTASKVQNQEKQELILKIEELKKTMENKEIASENKIRELSHQLELISYQYKEERVQMALEIQSQQIQIECLQKQMEIEHIQLERGLKLHSRQKENLQRDIEHLEILLKQSQHKHEQDLLLIQTQRAQKMNLVEKIQVLKEDLEEIRQRLFISSEENKVGKKMIEQFEKEIIQLNKQITNLQRQLKILREKVDTLQNGMQNKREQVSCSVLQKIQKIYQDELQEQPHLNLPPVQFIYLNTFFQGNLLTHRVEDKLCLIRQIQSFQGKNITKTRLLYTYEQKNKASFHDYIDGRGHLLCLIKTIQGNYLAGYYSGTYQEKHLMTEPSLLISLKANQSFSLLSSETNSKNTFKGMIYDQFFIIFGNNDIRIKIPEKQVFSNFGTNNSFFNSRGLHVDTVLGMGHHKETKFFSFQMYELKFAKHILSCKEEKD